MIAVVPQPPFSAAPAYADFIRGNVKNLRGYEKAGRYSFFHKVEKLYLLMIKRAQLI
jgi:hypothetical protein